EILKVIFIAQALLIEREYTNNNKDELEIANVIMGMNRLSLQEELGNPFFRYHSFSMEGKEFVIKSFPKYRNLGKTTQDPTEAEVLREFSHPHIQRFVTVVPPKPGHVSEWDFIAEKPFYGSLELHKCALMNEGLFKKICL